MMKNAVMYYVTLFMLFASATAIIHEKYPGFVGPRGKRNEIIYDDEPIYTDVSPMVLQNDVMFPLLEEKSTILDFEDKGIADDFDTQVSKRAMGFQGVRGKKAMEDQLLKRAMGFQGVRGKKDFTNHELLKRAMGFQGVRGKKYKDDVLKRGMGFYGIGGKKPNTLGKNGIYWQLSDLLLKRKLYEIRGKKGPSSNSFMAMRGKKSFEKNSLTDLVDDLTEDHHNDDVIGQSGDQNENTQTQE